MPSLALEVAGESFHGSWWAHPKSHLMFRLFEEVAGSDDVLVCRLVAGKVTYVHRRLWPSLVRLSASLPKETLAAIREEHTASGRHRVYETPFPRWVPEPVMRQASSLDDHEAIATLGEDLYHQLARKPALRQRPPARRKPG